MRLINLIWLIPTSIFMSMIVNHLADTLPIFRKILCFPICTNCKKKINLYEYYLARSCSHCEKKIPKRNGILPIGFIITYVLIFYFPPSYTGPLIALIVITFLSLIFIIDVEHKLILHPVSIFGSILFLIMGLVLNGWKETVIGGVAGFAILYFLYLFGIFFTKWMAKKRGDLSEEVALGYGDVNLSAILGLFFGWPRVIVLLFFTILLGGIFSGMYMIIMRLLKKYKQFTAIPYAPFMVISAIILLYISTPN